jgi:serine/threonine protein kinase
MVAATLMRVLLALERAHAVGVRHNDVKPGNINIVGDDLSTLKVLDWGAASALSADSKVGWAHFHAPEQWMSNDWNNPIRKALPEPYRSRQLSTANDASGDLYSVGALGIWMVAGGKTLATRDETLGALRAILGVDARGRRLLSLLERSVDLNPEKRFRSAEEFMDALRPLTIYPPAPQ